MTAGTMERRLLALAYTAIACSLAWAISLTPDPVPWLALLPATSGVAYASIGVFLVLRTEARLIGWLLVLHMGFIVHVAGTFLYEAGGPGWLGIAAPLSFNFLTMLTVALILFPTGRLASRVLAALLVAAIAVNVVSSTHWLGVNLGWWESLTDPEELTVQLSSLPLFLSFFEQARLYRRRTAIQQKQVKWFMLALATQPLYVVPGALGWPDWAFNLAQIPLSMVFPVTIFIAITRYRLYEIDRIISRTVGYALVLGVLGLLFIGGVTGVTALVPTQGNLAVALTTVAVVALFDPLRRRVVDAVDQRFDRTRYVARQVVEGFGRDVQDVTDLDEIGDRVHAIIGRTVAPRTVAVWQPRVGASS